MKYTTKLIKLFLAVIILPFVLSVCQDCFAGQSLLSTFSASKNLKAGSLREPYASIFAQNNINGWNPDECTPALSGSGGCDTLAKLRTEMWNKASQYDKESFMKTVSEENHSIAGVEGYMNQAIAYSDLGIAGDGTLASWLDGQCEAFRPASASCRGSHPISDEEQQWIDEALAGSNYVKFAVGNATGGSGVGAGKIVCVFKDGECRDDVDYNVQDGHGACSVYSPSADFGECWGLEMAEKWVEEMESECGSSSSTSKSSPSSSSAISTSSAGSEDGSNVTIIGDSITSAAQDAILNKLPQADIHAKDCKTVGADVTVHCGGADPPNESGLNIVKNLKTNGALRDKVVFALGTNGSGFDKLQEVVNEIGSDRQIYLMTLFETTADHSGQNETINQLANDNKNVTVFDWAGAVSGNTSLLTDGTHPNAEGSEIFANLIYDAVNKANCTTYEGDYPEYNQADERWGSIPYDSDSIAGSGCGPTSAAMLATVAAGEDIFPDKVVEITSPGDYVDDGGVALDTKLGEEYDFEVEVVSASSPSDAVAKMQEYLNQGYMIHTSGCGWGYSPTGGCHFVGIFELKDGQAFLADSSGRGNRWVDFEDFIMSGYHLDFTAIKGKGTRSTCDTDACSVDNTSISANGLSDEEASKLVDNYNGNVGNWDGRVAVESNYCQGDACATRYSNCVLFSAFFMEMFTDVGFGNGWPNGLGVVEKLGGMGFETGSEPRVFSVFSYNNHTGVVVRIDGDTIVTTEAGWPSWPGYVRSRSIQEYESLGTTYAYINDRLNQQELSKYIGSN